MSYQSLDDPTSDADSCSNTSTCNDAYNSTNKLDVGMNPLQRHDDERSSCYGMGGLGASSMDSTPTTMSHMLHDYWQQQYTEYQAQQQRIIAHDANSPRFSESTTTFAETKNSTTIDPESMIREARARAKLIVQRLGGTTTADDPGSTALEFTQQRIQALQLEEDRKRVYFNKNIAYATKIEQERLFDESQQAQQAQEWHAEYLLLLEQRQAAKLEQRKRAAEQLRESKLAGVGSQKQRTRNNREQRQVAGMPSKRSRGETSSQTATKTTVAVYVSGFPSDGSIDAEFLTALFSSYGSIRKAHLYRDRQTGRLKGDGLIIFEVSAAQGGEELILTVCEQPVVIGTHKKKLNGAELPCGNKLTVEPSESNNMKRYAPDETNSSVDEYAQQQQSAFCEGINASNSAHEDPNEGQPTDGDDLDDFFSSL